jgi:hypothetical protein
MGWTAVRDAISVTSENMLFTIIESFSPKDGTRWTEYCSWRKIAFERFDSIDGILRPSLFHPKDETDWKHVVPENFKIDFITDQTFALEKRKHLGKGDVVGLCFDEHDESDPRFLGYDLIDGCCSVSLFTNWGNSSEIINQSLSPNALVLEFEVASDIRKELLKLNADDGHVDGCRVISVYDIQSST